MRACRYVWVPLRSPRQRLTRATFSRVIATTFIPNPAAGSSTSLKILAVCGKSMGGLPCDSSGGRGATALSGLRLPRSVAFITGKEEQDGRATESRRGQSRTPRGIGEKALRAGVHGEDRLDLCQGKIHPFDLAPARRRPTEGPGLPDRLGGP